MKKPFLIASFLLLLTACSNKSVIDQAKNTVTEQRLELTNSHLYYETHGDPANEALLLIHGSGGDHSEMNAQIEFFKNDYFVIAGDSRTHGQSGDADSLSYELMANDCIAILNELGIDKTNLIGYSDGGIIALIIAMDYPGRVEKLISISPNLSSDSSSIKEWDLEMTGSYSIYIDSLIAAGDTSQYWQREKQHTDLLMNEPNIPVENLAKIAAPVLLIAADEDIIRLEHIIDIYRHIPLAHLHIYPGATHFLLYDEVNTFNEEALRFFSEDFVRPTSHKAVLEFINGSE